MKTLRLMRAMALSGRRGGRAVIALIVASLFTLSATGLFAQERQTTAPTPPSDLAKQNFERVAASAAQIEVILHKDVGLMVELKRWIAKDATDHGQIVSDSDLTDQSVYDRLETDVQFRSVATDLLQKFGYLLPQINPDSPQAKEQQLVIEARAKWIAQDDEEERTAVRQQARHELELAGNCDSRTDGSCASQQTAVPANQQQPTASQQSGAPNLRQNTTSGTPSFPATSQRSLPGVEQTQFEPQQLPDGGALPLEDPYGSLVSLANASSGAGPGTLAPTSAELGRVAQGQTLPVGMDGQLGVEQGTGGGINAAMQQAGLAAPGFSPTEVMRGSDTAAQPSLIANPNERYRPLGHSYGQNELSASQTLLRQSNPYVDVPSLYDMYLQAMPQPPEPQRFGEQVFDNGTRDLQMVPMDLPVGPDYVVGPGDSLAIDVWGGISHRFLAVVDRQGRVDLPEAGPVLVAGKSLADVQQSVQQTLRSQFRDVSADVSLARLRTIRVYVVGDVERPGAYDISSLSTPLNALFAAGGPTNQGSLRTVEHNRGAQLVQSVDLYDLLLNGVKADIRRLDNGDTVLVPPIGPQVSIEGMVRRPAVYELKDEKSLAQVLSLAGGLLPTATLRHIEVQRVVAHEERTMLNVDVSPDADPSSITKQLDSFQIQDGDKIRIFPIAPYNQDTVYLEGHVLRPGRYSYHQGMRVTDLVSSYKELLPEPAAQYAEIIRLQAPDFRPVVESFDLADALNHPGSAPLLSPLARSRGSHVHGLREFRLRRRLDRISLPGSHYDCNR